MQVGVHGTYYARARARANNIRCEIRAVNPFRSSPKNRECTPRLYYIPLPRPPGTSFDEGRLHHPAAIRLVVSLFCRRDHKLLIIVCIHAIYACQRHVLSVYVRYIHIIMLYCIQSVGENEKTLSVVIKPRGSTLKFSNRGKKMVSDLR